MSRPLGTKPAAILTVAFFVYAPAASTVPNSAVPADALNVTPPMTMAALPSECRAVLNAQ